jgi:phosphoglycerate dehydrogenase-like enzyme
MERARSEIRGVLFWGKWQTANKSSADNVTGWTTSDMGYLESHIKNLEPSPLLIKMDGLDQLETQRDKLGQIQAMIIAREDFPRPLIDALPDLKWIQLQYSGADRYLIPEVRERKVILTNARGIGSEALAEHAFALMLSFVRCLPQAYANQVKKVWYRDLPLDQLAGKTLGIAGFGAAGRELACKAKAAHMTVLASRRGGQTGKRPYQVEDCEAADRMFFGLEGIREMLPLCDFVTVVLPLTEETRGIFGEDWLRLMKPKAFLINVSRGGVVQERALIRALQEGWIRGMASDVFEKEPLPGDSPLWAMPNVIITNHFGAINPAYFNEVVDLFVRNVERFRNGKQLVNELNQQGY